ncbi:MAG: hypothetical protein ACE5IR_06730 [bacterium]
MNRSLSPEIAKQHITDAEEAKSLSDILIIWAERQNPALAEANEE